jgi:hypothetical protein
MRLESFDIPVAIRAVSLKFTLRLLLRYIVDDGLGSS